jgi:hypothetical protein
VATARSLWRRRSSGERRIISRTRLTSTVLRSRFIQPAVYRGAPTAGKRGQEWSEIAMSGESLVGAVAEDGVEALRLLESSARDLLREHVRLHDHELKARRRPAPRVDLRGGGSDQLAGVDEATYVVDAILGDRQGHLEEIEIGGDDKERAPAVMLGEQVPAAGHDLGAKLVAELGHRVWRPG